MTYKQAMKTLKTLKEKAGVLSWDLGNGWTAEAYWCTRRKRIVQVSINPEGMRIV